MKVLFDQYQRYKMVEELINVLRDTPQTTFSILEVGANEHRNLETFLHNDTITYLDIVVPEKFKNDPSFIEGDATDMPFDRKSFDIVIALDVYEHIFPEVRNDFLNELERVSKIGLIIAGPFNTHGVVEAEERTNDLYKDLYGYDFQWLKEHADNSLPNLTETLSHLESSKGYMTNFEHGSVDIWERLMKMHFVASKSEILSNYREVLDDFYNNFMFHQDYKSPCYRQFIIKLFEKKHSEKIGYVTNTSIYSVEKQTLDLFSKLEEEFYKHYSLITKLNEGGSSHYLKEEFLQIFWTKNSDSFTEDKSIKIKINSMEYINLDIPLESNVDKIRLDITNFPSYVEILKLILVEKVSDKQNNELTWINKEENIFNQNNFQFLNNNIYIINNDISRIVCLDEDPQILLLNTHSIVDKNLVLQVELKIKRNYFDVVYKELLNSTKLIRELKYKKVDLKQRNTELTEEVKEKQSRVKVLNSYNLKKNQKIDELTSQLDKANEELEKTKAELHEVFQSKSWRYTKFLRALSAIIKKVTIPMAQFFFRKPYHYALKPMSGLKKNENISGWDSLNDDPQFLLEGYLREGWYLVEWSGSSTEVLLLTLYFDTGSGFNDKSTITLGYIKEQFKKQKSIIYLPSDTERLRLDPGNSPASFSINNVRFTKINKIEVLFRGIGNFLNTKGVKLADSPILLRRAWKILKSEGIRSLWNMSKRYALSGTQINENHSSSYEYWLKNNTLTDTKIEAIKKDIEKFKYKPMISIIVPTYNVDEIWLRKCLDSVLNQIYTNWELCIADDASTKTHVRTILEEYVKRDARVKVIFRRVNGHISEASNSALGLATGEFIALLDHDDELSLDALYENVALLNSHPDADMIYSDEDKINEDGERHSPFFKPDWSPDTILSMMYTCHLSVYRTELIKKIGGFRKGFEGSQDHDLVLRVTEFTDKIFHIPKILYHWRTIKGSTAIDPDTKGYAHQAGLKAVKEALIRRGERAHVTSLENFSGRYQVEYLLPDKEPLVSIIIPTRDKPELLKVCLNSIFENTAYKNFEVIIADNGSEDQQTYDLFSCWKEKEPDRFNVLRLDFPFNYSRINNEAIKNSNGDLILLLNNDVKVITSDWISKMVGQAMRPNVGAVGAKLLYEDGTIQHAGVIVGLGGVAGHSHKGFTKDSLGYFYRLKVISNYSAVTAACLMIKKSVYEMVGGLDEQLQVAFNDVDFCLKVREAGFNNLVLPEVQLYHYESKSRGYEDTPEKQARFNREIKYMKDKWGDLLKKDPFYNPNLTLNREDFSIKN